MYRRKTVHKSKYHAALVLLGGTLLTLMVTILQHKLDEARAAEFYNPLSDVMVVEIDKPVEVVVEKTIGCESEKCEIMAYLIEKFGDEAANAITIIRTCENSTFDQTRTNQNKNGSTDYGVMQINSIHLDRCGEGIITDWKANIDCGYDIYQSSGWSAWSCSHKIGVKSFWQ